ncbi:MAG: translation termination inhibitor protein itt1 [Vezdaea aestivalis]|nr:MAG: translation termination inhibitor protein itt1 [Vezdaea aestivalis]
MADTNTQTPSDERTEELETIKAIYPELEIAASDPYTATLEIPVAPAKPLAVFFPPLADAALDLPTPPNSEKSILEDGDGRREITEADVHVLAHLPPLLLTISLPSSYPADTPPSVNLSVTPEWIAPGVINGLQGDVERLWEDLGKDQVVFAYIDHLQQAAERGFDLVDSQIKAPVEVPHESKIALLDFDIKAKQARFDKETFECGICLDPKKGSKCYRLQACQHVFCVACLTDFYTSCITEGEVNAVKCLDPSCGKDRSAPAPTPAGDETQASRPSQPDSTLPPSELLQIPLSAELVKRYVDLKHRALLSADKSTAYCPRAWCNGASLPPSSPTDRLAICTSCSYAFCRQCLGGWHGDLQICRPPAHLHEPSAEELASEEYLRQYSSPCPTCDAPCQKSSGCNHMICFRCQTHFCYLCCAYLEPANPYQHFNIPHRDCYMRLWELEEGDDEEGVRVRDQRLEAPAPEPGRGDDPFQAVPMEEVDLRGEFHPIGPVPVPDVIVPENLDEVFLVEVPMPPGQGAGMPRRIREEIEHRRRGGAPRGRGPLHVAPGRPNFAFEIPVPPPPQIGRGRGNGYGGRARWGGPGGRGGLAADARGIQRFLQLAALDREDEWDSEEDVSDDEEQVVFR